MSSGSKPLVQGCGEAFGVDGYNDTNSDTPGTGKHVIKYIKIYYSFYSINFVINHTLFRPQFRRRPIQLLQAQQAIIQGGHCIH
jgi:hypothetical protein